MARSARSANGSTTRTILISSIGVMISMNELEKYWKFGIGAAKIRWGSDGDFTRCTRHLAKHVGLARSKRICAQWHHDMTGIWPGHHGGDNKLGPG